jgi:hypothetical protein
LEGPILNYEPTQGNMMRIFKYRLLGILYGLTMLTTASCSFFNSQAPFFSDQQDIFSKVLKVKANYNEGFYWPYYVYIPKTVQSQSQSVILVEPLSDGKGNNDFSFHDKAAFQLIKNRKWIAEKLATPLIIPVFHRK